MVTKKKRGRPVGSKNKPKMAQFKYQSYNIDSFAETLKEWDEMENQTNWEDIVKKQEIHLQTYIDENEELAEICIRRWEEIEHLKYLVSYLEKRLENFTV